MGSLISPFVKNAYHINDETKLSVETINPIVLLHRNRLDIMAKLIYLEMKDVCPDYAKSIYLEHISAMTKGSFVEAGSQKEGKEAFLSQFDSLCQKMREEGYSSRTLPIPVDKNNQIMDGAHRVATALFLKIPVLIVRLPVEAIYDTYDSKYFIQQGVSEECIDAMVYRYIRLKDDIICINRWPSAKGHDEEFHAILDREYHLVYKKPVALNENGAFHYLAQIYKEYSWAQHSEQGFSGVYRKLMPCFPTFDPVQVYFVETDDWNKKERIKEEMRDLYGIEKHSLHATDSSEETIQMAQLLLSKNSVSFMNHCQSTKFSSTFHLLEQARKFDPENIVFTGSIVLALYGIREAEDLDYFTNHEDSNSHNAYLELYKHTLEEMLYDPRNSFTYFGLRFVTLNNIEIFKKNRNEQKDRDDMQLIQSIQMDQSESFRVRWLRFKRRTNAKVQGVILRVAHKTGTYDFLRKIYKKMKGAK